MKHEVTQTFRLLITDHGLLSSCYTPLSVLVNVDPFGDLRAGTNQWRSFSSVCVLFALLILPLDQTMHAICSQGLSSCIRPNRSCVLSFFSGFLISK